MEYPKKLRFTSPYRNYMIFLVSPTSVMVDGQLVRKEGKILQFQNWECTTEDEETIKLALESGLYGKDYIAPEWERMKMENKTSEVENEKVVSVQAKRGRPKKS